MGEKACRKKEEIDYGTSPMEEVREREATRELKIQSVLTEKELGFKGE